MLAYTPDQYSAFWNGVSAIATCVAAVMAIVTLLSLRRDSADRTRPVMLADLRFDALSRFAAILTVSNVGHSVAKNVRVSFDPPLPDLTGDSATGKVAPYLRKRYANPIPTVGPGVELFNVYAVNVPDDEGHLRNVEPTPDRFTITFDYQGGRGKAYRDAYDLDLAVLMGHSRPHPAGDDASGRQLRLVKALEAVARGVGRY